MTTHQLFLSYRKLNANFVRSIADWARASGITVWLDEDAIPLECGGSLIEGDEWFNYVENGITNSEYVLLLTNADWISSEACRRECDAAISAHRIESGKVLHICIPESPDVYKHYITLRSIPTLVWTTEDSFAQFLNEHCGLSLDLQFSPQAIQQTVLSWTATKNKLVSIRLPGAACPRRGVSVNKVWPSRSMMATDVALSQQDNRVGIKLNENPFSTFLALRIPEPTALASIRPRDEEIQHAYRGLARSFIQQHTDFSWLGTHQFWLDKLCNFGISYTIPAGHHLGHKDHFVIERLYSLQWRNLAGTIQGEVLLTFHLASQSSQSEATRARLALYADAIAGTVQIPEDMGSTRLNLRIVSLRGGLTAAIAVLLWLGTIPSDDASLSLVWTAIGWITGEMFGFALSPDYRVEQRTKAFLYSTWAPLLPLLWPVIACAVAISVFSGLSAHPLWWGGAALTFAFLRAIGPASRSETF